MPIVISPESELGKELAKWEQHRTKYVGDDQQPGNPYVFRSHPRMLYKAQQLPNGQTRCMVAMPNAFEFQQMHEYERAILIAETFNKSCQRIVHDEREEAVAKGQGWTVSPIAAMDQYEAEQCAIGQAAAENAYAVQRMTEKAKSEHATAEAATHEHVVDVVGGSKKRRGRKPKAIAGSGEVDA